MALLLAISLSVLAVALDSVAELHEKHGVALLRLEWAFTILFTIEYGLRLASVRRPWRYVFSFYGIVDLLSIIPTYLTLLPIAGETRSLLLIRSLRLLRIFRVLKLARYVGEAHELRSALRASQAKIFVFLWTVLVVVLIVGAATYLIEGPEYGFTSIPQSVDWAIVTMTTVGYGDIAPETIPGKVLASMLMITGYGIIAVPTGIVTVELGRAAGRNASIGAPTGSADCEGCGTDTHSTDALYCRRCGTALKAHN